MKRNLTYLSIIVLLIAFFIPIGQAFAQDYRFEVTRYDVQAIIEEDGSLTLLYEMDFKNATGAHAIDFVDLGLPYADYSLDNLSGTIDGKPIPNISNSAYVHGAELALGEHQIPAGGTGEVKAKITGITGVLTPYDQGDRENYVNFQFTPNYFDSNFDKSRNTQYRFFIVLPPAVGSEEGVYYKAEGWPGNDEAEASLTTEGQRVIYEWKTDNANTHSTYKFGAAFPASAVPESAVSTASKPVEPPKKPVSGGSSFGSLISRIFGSTQCLTMLFMGGVFLFIGIVGKRASSSANNTRKLAYLPPTLSVEGHGIKRGLTAVEAGILLEEPLDKVLTMILFGLLKKEAIAVTNPDPLKITTTEPLPAELYKYESKFIAALQKDKTFEQKTALQSMMIDLVRSVEGKMKGFSAAETKAYYQAIVDRAWQAVEQAQTPDVKSAQFDHTLEWTMLDKDFSGRTTRTFTDVPVFLPRWWGRYSPVTQPSMSGPAYSGGGQYSGGGGMQSPIPSAAGPSPRPSFSLPNLPGAAFAASVIDGGANMAKSVIGDTTTFTSGVTSHTNPIPVSSSGGGYSGGGGSSCACACACAGCACACAGGGR